MARLSTNPQSKSTPYYVVKRPAGRSGVKTPPPKSAVVNSKALKSIGKSADGTDLFWYSDAAWYKENSTTLRQVIATDGTQNVTSLLKGWNPTQRRLLLTSDAVTMRPAVVVEKATSSPWLIPAAALGALLLLRRKRRGRH